MEQQWHKDITITDVNAFFSIDEFRVGPEGNVHMLIQESGKDAVNSQLGVAYHDFRLLSYHHKEDLLKTFYFPETERLYNRLTVHIDKNQQVLCSGFYSEPNSLALKGSFSLQLDTKNGQFTAQDHQPFEMEMLAKYMTPAGQRSFEHDYNKGRRSTKFFHIDSLINKKNGGYILLGEFIQGFMGPEGKAGKYMRGNILMVDVDANGKISRTLQVPKNQMGNYLNNSYDSFLAYYDEEQIHFIYNDRIENIPYKERENLKRYNGNKKKSVCMMVSIDNTGKMTRKPLFYAAEQPFQIKPTLSKLLPGNKLLIYGQKGKTQSMGSLSLP